MEKMGIWKYSPAQMKPQIHPDLYDKIKARFIDVHTNAYHEGLNSDRTTDQQ